jgi:hypothetical protein
MFLVVDSTRTWVQKKWLAQHPSCDWFTVAVCWPITAWLLPNVGLEKAFFGEQSCSGPSPSGCHYEDRE